jgi:hypothetical protein
MEGANGQIPVRSGEISVIAGLSFLATLLFYGLGWAVRVLGKLFYFVLVGVLVYFLWMMYAGIL